MSPMHLQHFYGFTSISLKISASYSAINNILYDEANFVPIDVPHFFFKVFALKVKLLFLRTTSASSTSVEVVTGCKPTTSTVHKIILSGKFGKEQSLFKKSLVLFI